MKDTTPIIERCAAAFAEHRSIERAYAVVKADAHFGLSRYAQLDVDVNCGHPSLGQTSDLGLVHSLLPKPLPCEDPAYQYLLLICSVENHDHDAMRAFFDSVKQFFAYRSSTPQRNGSRVHELRMYPAIIPVSCDCDACFCEKERRYFQARFRRAAKEHPEQQGAEILRDTDNGFSVWFFSGQPGTQPHFRVYNNAEAEYAAQSAAVSLHKACYLPYADPAGKAPYCLPKRHRRKLMKLLQTPLPAGGLTHYEWMLRLAREARPADTPLPCDRPLPNYMYLPEEAAHQADLPADSNSRPTPTMKSSFDWEKISRTGQIGHKKPHKTAEEYERELREQRYPGMTDEQIREAQRQEAAARAEARARKQAEAEALRAHYAAAFAANAPAECDYAVVKVDKCFGLSIVEQLATPNTGGVPGVCRASHLGLENAHLPMVLKTEGEYKYLLLRSNVTNHNAPRRQAFFDSVQRFFDYRRTTPQWTGGKAHELRIFPKHIPAYCRCRHCLRENSRRMIARYNELNAQFPPLPPIEDQRRIYQEEIRQMQEYAQQAHTASRTAASHSI